LKEVLGMRERGFVVEVASINPPDRPRHQLPPLEAIEADHTYCVKALGIVTVALQLLAIAFTSPQVVFRGLRAALELGGLDLKARAFALFYLAEALLIGRWMKRRSLPHLHVHFGGPVATVGMLTAQAWQVPWSLTLHGPDEFFDQETFYLAKKIKSGRFIFCISDFCRSQVLRIAPEINESQVGVVRLGVDCAALQPKSASPAPQAANSTFRLACTGRMVAAKGHRILIESLSQLAAQGIDFDCTLIGDGPERQALESLSARYGLQDRIHFLGAMAHQPTLAQVAEADAFVLASFAEGLPVALMEAMALGVPCVSTTIAAIPELIQDRQNGLLVPPSNVEALTAALRTLAVDPELRRTLGRAARVTAEQHYNLATNLDLLASVWIEKQLLP
jgi:colanic acid/amylovoran biosynthesis glycosyltransferase